MKHVVITFCVFKTVRSVADVIGAYSGHYEVEHRRVSAKSHRRADSADDYPAFIRLSGIAALESVDDQEKNRRTEEDVDPITNRPQTLFHKTIF